MNKNLAEKGNPEEQKKEAPQVRSASCPIGYNPLLGEEASQAVCEDRNDHDRNDITHPDKPKAGGFMRQRTAVVDFVLGVVFHNPTHSNGYSLVRRVFADYTGEEVLPELEGKKLKDVLLEPTRIYVKAALPLIKEELVNGIAHITGGGFIENVPRMFSDDLAAEIDESKVPVLPIFKALEKYGEIKHEEMFEIFNMGIGLMLAVKPENVERVKELLDEPVYEIGRIVKKDGASVVIK